MSILYVAVGSPIKETVTPVPVILLAETFVGQGTTPGIEVVIVWLHVSVPLVTSKITVAVILTLVFNVGTLKV